MAGFGCSPRFLVGCDLRSGLANCSVIWLQAFQYLELCIPGKEGCFQLVQLAGNVVIFVIGGVGKNSREHLPCEDVLDEHFRSEERRVGKECRSRWSPY